MTSAPDLSAYVEVILDPWGPVYLDRQGYGHRDQGYTSRWTALGREASGWDQMGDGSFVSQAPLNRRGRPLDPSLPWGYDLPGGGVGVPSTPLIVGVCGAALALAWWLLLRKGAR